MGPEEPAVRITFSKTATESIYSWTKSNIGAMLAVVLDAEVVVYAKVAAAFGQKITLCLPGKTLEQANARSNDLLGIPN
jgi:preprotein translocase subunit SecD